MNNSLRSRPSLEFLEDRTCPAISAVQVGGILTITGAVTTPTDTLQINQTAAGSFTVYDGVTQVNGTFTGVTSLRAYLTSANDVVDLNLGGFAFGGSVSMNLGSGNDKLTVHDGTISGCLAIGDCGGDDAVTLTNVTVSQNAFINLGGGAGDSLDMNNADVTGGLTVAYVNTIDVDSASAIGGSVNIYGGNSTNNIVFDGDVGGSLRFLAPLFWGNQTGMSNLTLGANASVAQDLVFSSSWFNAFGATLTTAAGSSVGRDLYFSGTNNVDVVDLQGSIGRNATIVARDGADVVTAGGTISGRGWFDLGSGDDTLNLNGKVGGGTGTVLYVFGGSGDDTVTVASTATINGNGYVNLGSGDDVFTVQIGATFTGTSFAIYGGSGSDTATFNGVNVPGLTTNSVETITL